MAANAYTTVPRYGVKILIHTTSIPMVVSPVANKSHPVFVPRWISCLGAVKLAAKESSPRSSALGFGNEEKALDCDAAHVAIVAFNRAPIPKVRRKPNS